MDEPTKAFRSRLIRSGVLLYILLALVGTYFGARCFAAASGGDEAAPSQANTANSENMKYGLVAAALAFGLGAIGAGIAIAHVGAAAVGAVAEKPQVAGQALIFVALAEGLVVFGFITALMILGKV